MRALYQILIVVVGTTGYVALWVFGAILPQQQAIVKAMLESADPYNSNNPCYQVITHNTIVMSKGLNCGIGVSKLIDDGWTLEDSSRNYRLVR